MQPVEWRTTGLEFGSLMLPYTLSVTGNARTRNADGANMRRRGRIEGVHCANVCNATEGRADVETHQKDSQTHEAAAGEPRPTAKAVAYPQPRRRWRLVSARRRRKSWLLCLGEGAIFDSAITPH